MTMEEVTKRLYRFSVNFGDNLTPDWLRLTLHIQLMKTATLHKLGYEFADTTDRKQRIVVVCSASRPKRIKGKDPTPTDPATEFDQLIQGSTGFPAPLGDYPPASDFQALPKRTGPHYPWPDGYALLHPKDAEHFNPRLGSTKAIASFLKRARAAYRLYQDTPMAFTPEFHRVQREKVWEAWRSFLEAQVRPPVAPGGPKSAMELLATAILGPHMADEVRKFRERMVTEGRLRD